jgi:hypothetical protein
MATIRAGFFVVRGRVGRTGKAGTGVAAGSDDDVNRHGKRGGRVGFYCATRPSKIRSNRVHKPRPKLTSALTSSADLLCSLSLTSASYSYSYSLLFPSLSPWQTQRRNQSTPMRLLRPHPHLARFASTSVSHSLLPMATSPAILTRACSPCSRHPIPGSRRRRGGRVWHCLFCCPQTFGTQGRDQENYAVRSLDVLSPHPPRAQAPQIPQRGWRQRKRESSCLFIRLWARRGARWKGCAGLHASAHAGSARRMYFHGESQFPFGIPFCAETLAVGLATQRAGTC